MLAAERAKLKKKMAILRDELRQADAALKSLTQSRPKKTLGSRSRDRTKIFESGELGRLITEILRRAARPMDIREIAAAVMAKSGHDELGQPLFVSKARSALHYLEGRDGIMKVGRAATAKWSIIG